jgi:undecaprenyl-diphosphatase
MRGKDILLLILLFVAIFAMLATCRYAYFPGDVTAERFLQSLTPGSMSWALWITKSAAFPWSLILLAITFALSWALAGWRIALYSILSFVGMWILGTLLSPLIARPRPSPILVHVVGSPSGYSFPSIFALIYGSTVGFLAILAPLKKSGALRTTLLFLCCALLIIGGIARIAMGAHWPSDIIISYFLALLWAFFLIRIAPSK